MKQPFRRLTDNDKTEMMRGLNWAALDVEQNWLAADYPPAMQSDRAQFRHAHVHAAKALGKIAALVDHMDHERDADEEARALIAELPKLLADLIRCTAKMAETAAEPINLGTAYYNRSEQLAERWREYRRSGT
jgi:hypothetical protein